MRDPLPIRHKPNHVLERLELLEHQEIHELYLDLHPPRAPRVIRDRTNLMEEYNEEEFTAQFRVTKSATIGMHCIEMKSCLEYYKMRMQY